jgi:hypothetical protein
MRRIRAAGVAALCCLLLTGVCAAAAEPAESSGLSGSIWQPAEGSATYYVIHPDGTMVVHRGGSIGLGVWEPTGDLLLTGRVDFRRRQSGEWGTQTNRSQWVIDESAGAATVTSTDSFVGADGVAQPLGTESLTLERLHMAPMPANAHAETPPDPGWQAIIGPSLYDRTEAGVSYEALSPPNYALKHADGTSMALNPYVGDGVGLWAAVDDGWWNATMWYPRWRGSTTPLVGQSRASETGAVSTSYGTTDGFEGSAGAMPMRFESLAGELAIPDPSLWPTTGSVWVEPSGNDDGQMAWTAYLADGTIVTVDPRYGVGVGLWQPVDEDTFVSHILYKGGDWSLKAESTVGEDGESLATRWEAEADWTNPAEDEAGTSTARRMHLER